LGENNTSVVSQAMRNSGRHLTFDGGGGGGSTIMKEMALTYTESKNKKRDEGFDGKREKGSSK
jgi:hypothetical protein